jgi:hypothetical protein
MREDTIIRLTSWQMFPQPGIAKTLQTLLFIGITPIPRVIPTGSLIIWDGWARKTAHPP